MLYPLKANLEDSIARDEALVVKTLAEMDAATFERAKNKAEHEQYVEEAQAAIGALDDCLDLLANFEEGGSGAPSLI